MKHLRTLWGQRLVAARRAAGLTQVQLAAAAGVPQQYISHWERGRNAPRDANRIALARALGMSVSELFPYPDDDDNGDEAAA